MCFTHLTYSNYLYQAVSQLKEKEPILFRLLVPHILNANNKNSDAYWNLYNGKGVLLAAIGEIENRPYIISEFENDRREWLNNGAPTFLEWKEKNPAFCKTKYVERGTYIYEKIQEYVLGYFKDNGVTDKTFDNCYIDFWAAIQEMLGGSNIPLNKCNVEKWVIELIWRVTYFHYQVGNALPYLYDCDKIRWNRKQTSEGSLWSLVVGFATSSRQYQMVKFPYLTDPIMSRRYTILIDSLINYKDEFDNDKVDGYPQWVWELEPSVAR